jgi:hypothetical protein
MECVCSFTEIWQAARRQPIVKDALFPPRGARVSSATYPCTEYTGAYVVSDQSSRSASDIHSDDCFVATKKSLEQRGSSASFYMYRYVLEYIKQYMIRGIGSPDYMYVTCR